MLNEEESQRKNMPALLDTVSVQFQWVGVSHAHYCGCRVLISIPDTCSHPTPCWEALPPPDLLFRVVVMAIW